MEYWILRRNLHRFIPVSPIGVCDSITPKNCLSDTQIQAEVKKAMALKGWKGGLQTIFFVYTSKGEGSCVDLGLTSCAYTQYCAYHGVIQHANLPYGESAYCQTPAFHRPMATLTPTRQQPQPAMS